MTRIVKKIMDSFELWNYRTQPESWVTNLPVDSCRVVPGSVVGYQGRRDVLQGFHISQPVTHQNIFYFQGQSRGTQMQPK